MRAKQSHSLREARMNRMLSQRELAFKLGVTERSVSYWETGKLVPRWNHKRLLIEHLGVDASVFDEDHEGAA